MDDVTSDGLRSDLIAFANATDQDAVFEITSGGSYGTHDAREVVQ